MDSLAAVSGLVSGLNWREIIDDLIALDRRSVEVFAEQRDDYDSQLSEWKNMQSLINGLKASTSKLSAEKAFKLFTPTMSSSSTKDPEDIINITTTTSAGIGSYDVRVMAKAESQKLGSATFAARDTALGYSGEFVINGKGINVQATDTLENILDNINTQNTGVNATGVTATLLSRSDTEFQIILTADDTGEDGFSLLDASSTNILQSLGFSDTTTSIKTQTSDGAKGDGLSSSATAVASLLGLTGAPGSTSVTIGGQAVNIDLTTESLSDIAGNINALTGITATVATETDSDDNTVYRLDISGTTSFTDSSNVLQTLGILVGDRASIAEVHSGATANTRTSAAGGGAITDATLWSQINTGSDANNVAVNDTITISGKNNSGTAVTSTFTITNTSDALNAAGGFLETIETAFGGAAAVNAYISDGTDGNTAGQLVVQDLVTGESQLEVEILTNNQGGGTLDFGTMSETVAGRSMQLQAGQNASVEVDNVTYSRASNSVADLISGVTLDLVAADTSTTVTLNISRDIDAIKAEINGFVSAYNALIEEIDGQLSFDTETEEPGGILFGDGTLRSVSTDLSSEILQTIGGISSTYTSLGLIGINLELNGALKVNDAKLTEVLTNNYEDVLSLLSARGSGSISGIKYVGHDNDTKAGTYAVNITAAAERGTTTGSTDLSGGLAGAETVTITDTGTSRVATISLDAGDDIDEVVSKFNSEFTTEYAQALTDSVTNAVTSGNGGGAITSASLWSAINTGGDANDIANNDTITISGTRRNGVSVFTSYTISDTSTDTIQGLLSAVESAFNNEVYATIDTNGAVVLTDRNTGTSQLDFDLTANNEGGGSLAFGSPAVSTTGRYSIEMSASKNGSNQLVLSHNLYGSKFGFTISQTTNNLGITDSTYSGVDVAGTINGETATGAGQTLTGDTDEANIDGLVMNYTGTATGAVGNLTLTFGFFEEISRKIFDINDDFDGYVPAKVESLGNTVKRIDKRIVQLEDTLEAKRLRLISKFLRMEDTIARLSAQSAWLSSQSGLSF